MTKSLVAVPIRGVGVKLCAVDVLVVNMANCTADLKHLFELQMSSGSISVNVGLQIIVSF